jgi:hypothetical protein
VGVGFSGVRGRRPDKAPILTMLAPSFVFVAGIYQLIGSKKSSIDCRQRYRRSIQLPQTKALIKRSMNSVAKKRSQKLICCSLGAL